MLQDILLLSVATLTVHVWITRQRTEKNILFHYSLPQFFLSSLSLSVGVKDITSALASLKNLFSAISTDSSALVADGKKCCVANSTNNKNKYEMKQN